MIVNPHIIDLIKNNESNHKKESVTTDLQIIDSFEKKLNELLPKIIVQSKSQEKVEAFTLHLKFTLEHLSKIKNLLKNIHKNQNRRS